VEAWRSAVSVRSISASVRSLSIASIRRRGNLCEAPSSGGAGNHALGALRDQVGSQVVGSGSMEPANRSESRSDGQ
jgi:hypothetical protein